jgi:drug/metabolite transporter (DMT)-like permease
MREADMTEGAEPGSRLDGRAWALLVALSIVWGGSFFFAGVAVRELPTFTIVAARVALAALTLWAALAALGLRAPRGRAVWAAFLGMGLLNNAIPFSLIVWGQAHIASGLAAVLNATTPIFSVIVAHLLTGDEKLTPARLGGVALGLGGVAALMGPEALDGFGADLPAQAAVLCAALSYACAGVFGRRFRRMGVAPLPTAAGQLAGSSLILVPLALAVDRPWALPAPGAETIAAPLALATVSTALAYVMFFRILASAGATNVMLVTLLVPVSATALGVAFLGEAVAPRQALGMALIGLGLAAIDGRPVSAAARFTRRRRAGKPPPPPA